ncbi:MAG: hypothetical protein Kow0029_01780 [Candidatus Rifleibacteriota bacterium]
MRKLLSLLVLISFVVLPSPGAQAKNPIISYFSRLLDESRAEVAVGEILREQFFKELQDCVEIVLDEALTQKVKKIAESTSRPQIQYQVYIIKSDIPDEIVFPGGTIILTSGLLKYAQSDLQLNFILGRNLMHIVLRHPMKLLKKEGLYAGLLNQVKLASEKRDYRKIREMTRDYLRNLAKMDHKKADLQGILLSSSPESTRKAAIELLNKFSGKIWPTLPMDTGDLPGRIGELEKLKLPE